MDNRIKIFFEDSDDEIEKTFEKHSQEMRARMDLVLDQVDIWKLFAIENKK